MSDTIGWSAPTVPSSIRLACDLKPASSITFGYSSNGIRIHFDPLSVEMPEGMEADEAARRFWNAVAGVIGRPPVFPENAP